MGAFTKFLIMKAHTYSIHSLLYINVHTSSVTSDSLQLHRLQSSSRRIFLVHGSNPSLECHLHWPVGSFPPAPPGKALPWGHNHLPFWVSWPEMKVAPLCLNLCNPSPGQNTGVGRLSLLIQGTFPTQGWNPGLPHCKRILYQLSHTGGPYSELCCLEL